VTVTTDVIDGDHSADGKVSSVLPPADDIAVAAEIRIERAVETQANGRETCEPPLTPMRDERDAGGSYYSSGRPALRMASK
jgi:hypothetical protein